MLLKVVDYDKKPQLLPNSHEFEKNVLNKSIFSMINYEKVVDYIPQENYFEDCKVVFE